MRSRGNEMTVTRRGLSEMCTSMLTSLSSPAGVRAGAAVAEDGRVRGLAGIRADEQQVDAALDRPDVGRNRVLPSSSTAPLAKLGGDVVRRIRSDADAGDEHDGQRSTPMIFRIWANGFGDFSSPWRATVRRPRFAGLVDWLTRVLSGSDHTPIRGPHHTYSPSTAEGVGFEPTGHCCPLVFKTRSIGRSDNPPEGRPHCCGIHRTGTESSRQARQPLFQGRLRRS